MASERMKTILVVGDSFMYPDREFPNTHWTEIVTNYKIVNYSFPGVTNAQIFLNLINGLTTYPDYVYLWFTGSQRLEYENRQRVHQVEYITDCNPELLDSNQLQLMKYYYAETPKKLLDQKSILYIVGALSYLRAKNIKFLYSYGLFEESLNEIEKIYSSELQEFEPSYLQMSALSNYRKEFTRSPVYHTDEQWQRHLALTITNAFQNLN